MTKELLSDILYYLKEFKTGLEQQSDYEVIPPHDMEYYMFYTEADCYNLEKVNKCIRALEKELEKEDNNERAKKQK